MDGMVKDIMWCGTTNENILVLTQMGSAYRSRDKGYTWKRLSSLMSKSGSSVADAGQDVRSNDC